ncbi:MAG: hypothetical protein K1X67_09705 [Fimbriimonadaceae bacterium]|nr:hypothetical protein [Fimbriimonadaceae bacterium]
MKKLMAFLMLGIISGVVLAGCGDGGTATDQSQTVPTASSGEAPKTDEKSGNQMAPPEKASTD